MAKGNGPTSAQAPAPEAAFDYTKYLPEGVKAEDLTTFESLTPIYNAETALEEKWEPVVGYAYATEALKTLREGKDGEYTPIMIRVHLTHPTKARAGTKESPRTVDMKAGEDIYVPVNSALEINKRLEAAIMDTEKVHLLIFRVTGTMKTEHPNDMFTWEVKDTNHSKPRTGKYAFVSNDVMKLDGTTRLLTSGGTADRVTGEIREPAASQVS